LFRLRFGFARQLLLFTIVLLALPCLLTFYMLHTINRAEETMVANDRAKMGQAMRMLDAHFHGTFQEILDRAGVPDGARLYTKARVLNTALRPIIQDVSASYPGMELGFYSKDLDIILDGNPESYDVNFSSRRKNDMLRSLQDRKPVINVIGLGKTGLLEAYMPLERNGEVIGLVVARENMNAIYQRLSRVRTEAYAVIILGVLVGVGGFFALLNRFLQMTMKVKDGLRHLENDLSYRLPPAVGELGEIASAVNHLAARLGEVQSYNEIILDSIDAGIIAVNMDGRLMTANPSATRMFGLTNESMEQDFRDVLPPDSPARTLIARALECGETVKEMSTHWTTPRGEVKDLVCTTGILFNARRERVGVVLTCKDVTEKNRLEERIRRQEKLASLGKFVAGVAHEIRNPLTSISGYIQHWQKNNTPSAQAVATVCREVMRLNAIVDKLLFFARPAESKFGKHDLNQLVERALQFFITMHDDKVQIVKELTPDLPPVRIDPEQIQQVLVNMLYNAVQAMPDGGTLTVGTAHHRESDMVTLKVTDTGIGIPEENLSKIFDPFFTTRARGSGLGLALAHEIVGVHGGHIEVRSRVGEGTTFTVYLPRYRGEEEVS